MQFYSKAFLPLFLIMLCAITVCAQSSTEEALAYQYYQQGEFDKAADSFGKLFEKNKNDTYFEFYFISLVKIKKYQEAEAVTKRMIKQNPQKSQYLISLGRVYQESGKNAEADKIFQEAIKNTPKDELKIRELANNFYRIEAYDMAILAFEQGRKVLGDENAFTYELLNIYRFKKDKIMLVREYVNSLAANPNLILQAQSALGSVFDSNSDYQLLQTALLKKMQKEPDVGVYTELLIWQYIQQQEYEMALRQLIAFDKRTKADGLMIYNTANIFITNKAFETAQKAFEYLLTKGQQNELYIGAKIQLINVKYELAIAGKIDGLAMQRLAGEFQEVITTYGISSQTLFAIKKLAQLKGYYLNDLTGAEKTLEQAIVMKSLSQTDIAQLKLDLGDIYILTNQPWEAILVYEQVATQFENKDIGNEAKYKSAQLSFFQGNFEYAKSQANILKASTTQLIANDALNLSLLISDNLQNSTDSAALKIYADAELLSFVNKNSGAIKKLDSINLAYPNNSLNDDILMAKAKIYIKQNDNELAAATLKSLVTNEKESIWMDDALFTLADLFEKKLNNKEEAKKLYQQLITQFSGSMFNTEARKRFRNIRGDNLGS